MSGWRNDSVFLAKAPVSIKETIMKNLLTRIFVGLVVSSSLAWSQTTTLKPRTTTTAVAPARGTQTLPTTPPPAIVNPGPKRSDSTNQVGPYGSSAGDV